MKTLVAIVKTDTLGDIVNALEKKRVQGNVIKIRTGKKEKE